MPTYEYKCSNCENEQEEVHGMLVSPVITCNECGSLCEKQFVPNGNFILKGNNWPSRDFKTKKEMNAKSSRMKTKMEERTNAGEGVTKLSDIKK